MNNKTIKLLAWGLVILGAILSLVSFVKGFLTNNLLYYDLLVVGGITFMFEGALLFIIMFLTVMGHV